MDASQGGWDEPLGPIKGFMFDLDGTLILSDRSLGGYKVLPGAVEVLNELRKRGLPYVVLTNGSAYPAAERLVPAALRCVHVRPPLARACHASRA